MGHTFKRGLPSDESWALGNRTSLLHSIKCFCVIYLTYRFGLLRELWTAF